jgi:hypothetical protein
MNRRIALRSSIVVLLALLGVPPWAGARDPTIGLCTRKDDMAKALEALDSQIQELTSAADDAKRAEIGRRIAKERGVGVEIEALIRYREPAMKHVFLNFAEEKKTVQVPVVALVYDPARTDKDGFPGLGIVVKMPDGSQRTLPAQKVEPLSDQVSWFQGYVKNCAGWFNPQPFIEGINKKAAEAQEEPGKKAEGEGKAPEEKKG